MVLQTHQGQELKSRASFMALSGLSTLDVLIAALCSPCIPSTLQLIYGHRRLIPIDRCPTAPVHAQQDANLMLRSSGWV